MYYLFLLLLVYIIW